MTERKQYEVPVCIVPECGSQAAADAAEAINAVIKAKGTCNLVLATGNSQLEFLHLLSGHKSVDWEKVTAFHLDEYIGLPADHPASFVAYLKTNFVSMLDDGVSLHEFHFIKGGTADAHAECDRVSALISPGGIDLLVCGIGENGHLAFNDPPCDMVTQEMFSVVTLNESCREQQVGEGWFNAISDVPTSAISMTINGILSAKKIIAVVPEKRKAIAVKNCLTSPKITPAHPASALRYHANVSIYLDPESASLLGDAKPDAKEAPAKPKPAPKSAPTASGSSGRPAHLLRTFRPGVGWVEVGNERATERGILRGQMSPMDIRRKKMAARRRAKKK